MTKGVTLLCFDGFLREREIAVFIICIGDKRDSRGGLGRPFCLLSSLFNQKYSALEGTMFGALMF